jgi:hypothetical protein
MTKRYYIESRGVASTPGQNRVIDTSAANTGVLYFATQGEALAHKAAILPDQPSKYLPLVVTSETIPDQPISRTCVKCGQLTLTSADPLCDQCYESARQPQGETVRLFEPAPAQLQGELTFDA